MGCKSHISLSKKVANMNGKLYVVMGLLIFTFGYVWAINDKVSDLKPRMARAEARQDGTDKIIEKYDKILDRIIESHGVIEKILTDHRIEDAD